MDTPNAPYPSYNLWEPRESPSDPQFCAGGRQPSTSRAFDMSMGSYLS